MKLFHHGIKGQKWGVRRYQNEDGTLTTAGKRRRKTNISKDLEFDLAERYVKKRLSNDYEKFKKQNIDISIIKSRSGLTDYDAVQCGVLSTKKFNEASKLEPTITKDVVSSVAKTGCKMYGLEYRLKQPTSMAGKIGSDSKEKGISFQDAANGIKDAIRYTAVSNTKDFVDNYNNIKKILKKEAIRKQDVKTFLKNISAENLCIKLFNAFIKTKMVMNLNYNFKPLLVRLLKN